MLTQCLDLALQLKDTFVLLDKHRKQHDLERKQMGGVGGGRQMMTRRGQKVIQSSLVWCWMMKSISSWASDKGRWALSTRSRCR